MPPPHSAADRGRRVAGTGVKSSHALGMSTLARGATEFLAGRFMAGLQFSDRAAVILREYGTGVTWELGRAQVFGILSLFYAGRVSELRQRIPRVVQEGAIAPVPRISTKSGPFSPGEWLESLLGSARGY